MLPLLGLLAPLVSIGRDWLEGRTKIKAAKVDAKIKRIQVAAQISSNADMASIEAQRYSLKDEILMLILLAPFVGSFIPKLQPYVQNGFEILATTPYWYQGVIVGMFVSVFGLRFMLGSILPRKKKA